MKSVGESIGEFSWVHWKSGVGRGSVWGPLRVRQADWTDLQIKTCCHLQMSVLGLDVSLSGLYLESVKSMTGFQWDSVKSKQIWRANLNSSPN